MGVNRRDFLKITGLSTLLGVGGKATQELLRPGSLEASEAGSHQKSGPSGIRWAMVVDARKCIKKIEEDGCKDCSKACHATHNVPGFKDAKNELKWIWQETYEHGFPSQHHHFVEEGLENKPFIMLCNHCDNPPCVRVCPTQATFRRDDGIVTMDFHRCIGCRYCMAACPYGSRSFNWKDPRGGLDKPHLEFPTRMRGVVEKCNFCVERLAKDLPPACVEACRVKALTFGNLEDAESDVRKLLRHHYAIRRKPELGTMPEIYYIV